MSLRARLVACHQCREEFALLLQRVIEGVRNRVTNRSGAGERRLEATRLPCKLGGLRVEDGEIGGFNSVAAIANGGKRTATADLGTGEFNGPVDEIPVEDCIDQPPFERFSERRSDCQRR